MKTKEGLQLHLASDDRVERRPGLDVEVVTVELAADVQPQRVGVGVLVTAQLDAPRQALDRDQRLHPKPAVVCRDVVRLKADGRMRGHLEEARVRRCQSRGGIRVVTLAASTVISAEIGRPSSPMTISPAALVNLPLTV